MMRKKLHLLLLLGSVMVAMTSARAQEILIWHDKGDDGLKMIDQMAALYKRDHPGITVKSLSMPTDQWFSRSIAGLNTGTAADILFNDNTRLVQVQQSTGKLVDLQDTMAGVPAADLAFLSAQDRDAASFKGKTIFVPFQRTITGWGVRKSWLDKVGEPFPRTWDDALRVARKFQDEDPDGNGKRDTFGIAMQAGDASSMLGGGISLLVYGNRLPHPLVDEKGEVAVDRPEVARATIEYLKLFTQYKLVSPETVNQTFTDMYQLIEGGRVGMFRTGNWNVGKWDKQPPAGDYVVGPYPAFDGNGAMIVGSIRGMAVTQNSKHKGEAEDFLRFILSKGAQQISLDNMGGVVRTDLDTAHVTPGLRPFLAPDVALQSDDFLSSAFPWYLKLQESYYRLLIGAVSAPPADWDAWIKTTADKLRAEQATLKSKS